MMPEPASGLGASTPRSSLQYNLFCVHQLPKLVKPLSDFLTSLLHIYNHVSNVEYTTIIKTKLGLNIASEACQIFSCEDSAS